MEMKLTKTFLSQRPSSRSFMVSVIGLAVLAMFFGADQSQFSGNGYLVFDQKQYWRAFTTTLLHADLNHLAHNAFFFAGLAGLLHNYFGLWVFPVLSLIVGGLINLIALSIYPPEVQLVGVSGVVYFMAAFWLTLYILIEKRQKLWVRFVHAIAVSLIFLFPQVFEARTSYLAHGLGYLFGLPLGVIYYLIFKKEIRSQEVWTPVKKQQDEDIILLDPNSYHLVTPEEDAPSEHALDSSQSRSH